MSITTNNDVKETPAGANTMNAGGPNAGEVREQPGERVPPAVVPASASAVHGTQEWANCNVNIQNGCEHDCRYCYAKAMAIRFGRATAAGWKTPGPLAGSIRCRKRAGTIMHPSTHDITPENLGACLDALERLLKAGNRVLIVTKPHLACIKGLCRRLKCYLSQVLFRFTIGSVNDRVLKSWEPGAPSYTERLAALRHAYRAGFVTSVSCEPMLDANIHAVIKAVRPFVTDSVWLGRANRLIQIVTMNCPGDAAAVLKARELNATWNDDAVRRLYAEYRHDKLIRWKDSIRKVVGLEDPHDAGIEVLCDKTPNSYTREKTIHLSLRKCDMNRKTSKRAKKIPTSHHGCKERKSPDIKPEKTEALAPELVNALKEVERQMPNFIRIGHEALTVHDSLGLSNFKAAKVKKLATLVITSKDFIQQGLAAVDLASTLSDGNDRANKLADGVFSLMPFYFLFFHNPKLQKRAQLWRKSLKKEKLAAI